MHKGQPQYHPTHHAKQQLDRYTHFHTTTQQIPHWLQWDAANSPPKLPLPLRRSPPKFNTPIPSPTPLTTPNGIQIQSAVLPQLTHRHTHKVTDATDRPTHASVMTDWKDGCGSPKWFRLGSCPAARNGRHEDCGRKVRKLVRRHAATRGPARRESVGSCTRGAICNVDVCIMRWLVSRRAA